MNGKLVQFIFIFQGSLNFSVYGLERRAETFMGKIDSNDGY